MTSVYQTNVGRAPSSAELAAMQMQLANGSTTMASFRTGAAYSTETASIINQMYQQILSRSASSNDLAPYQTSLASGNMMAGIRLSIAYSGEASEATSVYNAQQKAFLIP